jgi:hypothetical protein
MKETEMETIRWLYVFPTTPELSMEEGNVREQKDNMSAFIHASRASPLLFIPSVLLSHAPPVFLEWMDRIFAILCLLTAYDKERTCV